MRCVVRNFAIGDIQGCYTPLLKLLDTIQYQDSDRLWFVGDLVNRGPDSLSVLRFIKNLKTKPIITLGNHDLHLLASIFTSNTWKNNDDTLVPILMAPDRDELGTWLLSQNILVYDEALNVVMTHAGIPPTWDLALAIRLARELEDVLQSDNAKNFLAHMYGNEPHRFSEGLSGMPRWRIITNYFTRMRFCDEKGGLLLDEKGPIEQKKYNYIPWFELENRTIIKPDIIFGHWAALEGKTNNPHIHAIDTGCLWGGKLTALRLEDKIRFSV